MSVHSAFGEAELKGTATGQAQYLASVPRTVTVSGDGDVRLPADRVVVSLKVTTDNRSLQEALRVNQDVRARLLAYLKKQGIAAERVQASKFSSTPRFGLFGEKAKSYRVENVVKVTVLDEKEFQGAAGAVDGWSEVQFVGAEFEHVDKDALKAKAIEQACDKANARKKIYEEKLGVKLVPAAFVEGRVAQNVPTRFVRRAASVKECRKFKATDWATRDLDSAVEGGELIVLCTPISQMRALVQRMIPSLKRGAIVTDVGSVKGSVVRDLESLLARGGAHFVGSHPMAGAEKNGVAAARADLFCDAVCVVTPTRNSHEPSLNKVEELWKTVGARVMRLTPETHDELVSRSSHLPHVVAAELANYVLSSRPEDEQEALCANGFRDTTRIASGSPEMWRDIALANRDNLDLALGRFIKDLEKFRRALKSKRANAISQFFEEAKQRRDRWAENTASATLE